MSYFVGYRSGAFDASDPLEPMPLQEGDVVFLVAWAKDGGALIGLIVIGEMDEHALAPGMAAAASLRFRKLPIPQHLAHQLPQPDEVMLDVRLWLHPVDDHVGGALLKIVEDHLGKKLPLLLGQKRTRAKRQKSPEESPEQLVKEIEQKAKKRLGQEDFREVLLRAYGGRCAISECGVDEALSAAHIFEYSKSECQEVWNGILLRADIHLLFDRHLLRIFPGNPPVVVLDEDIRESAAYKLYHCHWLRPANPFDERTNQELCRPWDAVNQAFRHFPDP